MRSASRILIALAPTANLPPPQRGVSRKWAAQRTKGGQRLPSRKRWPLQSKTKTQQGFTDLKTKAQVREKNGRRSKIEDEESNLLLVDNSVDKMWITFKRIKCNRYHMKKNRACNRYHILKKVATIWGSQRGRQSLLRHLEYEKNTHESHCYFKADMDIFI